MSEKPKRPFCRINASTALILVMFTLLVCLSERDLYVFRPRPMSLDEERINSAIVVFGWALSIGVGALFLESIHPWKEKGHSFRLSTLIILMLIAGIMVWMNSTPRYFEYNGVRYNLGYGWPLLASKTVSSWYWSQSQCFTAWIKNGLLSLIILSVSAILFESLMHDRRVEARRT